MTVQKETKSHPDVLNYPFIYPVLNYNKSSIVWHVHWENEN